MTATDVSSPFVDDVLTALRERDLAPFDAAGDRLVERFERAPRSEREAVVVGLAPALGDAPLPYGARLGQHVGRMLITDGDVTPVLGALVERACQVMESTQRFAALHRELLGDEPDLPWTDEDHQRLLRAGAASRVDDLDELVLSWRAAPMVVQVVLILSQRGDVRRALTQRDRLMAAAVATADTLHGFCPDLIGLLRILDDETLVVLHRATGAAFCVTISGIATNFQLHTLLAAHVVPLLPAPRRGLLRRRDTSVLPDVPTPEMTAAADGSGPWYPDGGMVGVVTLIDGNGKWILHELRPDTIPLVDGVRVVVLDPLLGGRAWDVGRHYPLLRATVDVVPLPADEARSWLSRVAPAS
ncbi:hypothetical protein [Cellulomonas cellasea]|uniref:Uncharacterized protein n=1 Tax=Cellulomonas cellasea TaxID=43670 RepID=A0A7W4UFH3_9CELL|nr:hypothetical protein [Cellulomonas cellasea]MBB2923226.1 hypothetical protein [Cellulomonas cellasea]